jgi:hypothetical protein
MALPRRELLILGNLSDDDLKETVAFLKNKGLSVFSGNLVRPGALLQSRAKIRGQGVSPAPKPDELQAMVLPAALRNTCSQPVAHQLLGELGVNTALDLTRLLSDRFMRFEKVNDPRFDCRIAILEFMVQNFIPFRDLNPCMVLRTRIVNVKELKPLKGPLHPIRWLEILAFLPEHAISDIRNVGPDKMKQLKTVMKAAGISFLTER